MTNPKRHDLDSKTQILLVTKAKTTPATHAMKFARKIERIDIVIFLPKIVQMT